MQALFFSLALREKQKKKKPGQTSNNLEEREASEGLLSLAYRLELISPIHVTPIVFSAAQTTGTILNHLTLPLHCDICALKGGGGGNDWL